MYECLDECGISPFSTFDGGVGGSKLKGMTQLLSQMTELKYMAFNHQRQQLELTAPGVKYLREHAQEMKYLLAKYNITPADYGELACFFPLGESGSSFQGWDLSRNQNVLGKAVKIDQTGEVVDDYDRMEFTEKAPGDVVHPMM